MTDGKGQDRSARIGLTRPAAGRLDLKKPAESNVVRQSFSHGRSKAVAVEVKKARPTAPSGGPGGVAGGTVVGRAPAGPAPQGGGSAAPVRAPVAAPAAPQGGAAPVVARAPAAPAPAVAPAAPAREAPAPAAAAPAAVAAPAPAAPVPAPAVAAAEAVGAEPPPAAAPVVAEAPPAAPAPAAGPRMTAPPPAGPRMTAPPPSGPRMTAPPPSGPRMTAPPPAGGIGPRMTAPPPAGARPGAPSGAGQRPAAPGGRPPQPAAGGAARPGAGSPARRGMVLRALTDEEKANRLRVLGEARRAEDEARQRAEENARRAAEESARRRAEEEASARRKVEDEARRKAEDEARRRAEEQAAKLLAEEDRRQQGGAEPRAAAVRSVPSSSDGAGVSARPNGGGGAATARPAGPLGARPGRPAAAEPEDERRGGGGGRGGPRGPGGALGARPERRPTTRPRPGLEAGPKKIERHMLAPDAEIEERGGRSLAALRRSRERERRQAVGSTEAFVRDVVLPETITVQDLAARMAVRGAEVVKVLMKNGILATINQLLDADTAELVVSEFGHRAKRVSEADVEVGIEGEVDRPEELLPRPPVVTVMGHVDHGKTSLLDSLRSANVAAGEAGGITQHIGAYRVDVGHGRPVTFIDTPGHAAFTAMRARGASVTDVVILVVAADDGVMPQTVEAISHAKAAKVPMIVAINKIDKPDANPDRVKQELLSHDVVLEDFGGDVQSVAVSATQRTNLDRLIESVQLQAELLDLRANPAREAHGTIIEAKLDRGRGVVATVLVQRGTLKVGDIVVAGAQSGRVRALVDDRGENVPEAGPAMPVEILGLDGVPEPGDELVAVDGERQAREITEYRQRKRRDQGQAVSAGTKSTLEEMFSQLRSGVASELPVVVKSDVQGSLEAITAGMEKMSTDEVKVRNLFGGVGAITESDVTLAAASRGLILGFNVRANAQAREMAKRDGVEVRYYSIIYELLDEVRGLLSGMLKPESREVILGHAEIRQVFEVSKVGKIAGCRVVDGLIKRTARARLLRDNVVTYDGVLGSLKRFKDDVREVRDGFECGMSIENYNDIRVGDVIEAYEVEEVARSL